MKKSVLIGILKYGLGLGLLAWVIWSNWHISRDGEEMGLVGVWERPIHWHWYGLGLVIAMAGILLTFVRWYILVRAQDLPFTLASALRLGMIGFYFNTLLPGSVGGDIIKAACIAREQSRRTVAVATVIADRIVGFCGLIWLVALLGGAFWITGLLPEIAHTPAALTILETIFVGATGLTAGSLIFWVFLGFLAGERAERLARKLADFPKIGPPLADLWRAADMYRSRGQSIGLALLMSMVGHLGFVMVFICSSWTLNARENTPSFLAHFLVVPVGMTIQAGFPSPGGVGGGEVAFGELYAILGFPAAGGILGSLVQRSLTWVLALVGFLVYLGMKPRLANSVPT